MSSFEQKLLDKVEHLERQLEASQKECERLREIVEGMDLFIEAETQEAWSNNCFDREITFVEMSLKLRQLTAKSEGDEKDIKTQLEASQKEYEGLREILSNIMQCVEHLGMNSSDEHTLAWVDELCIGVEKLTTKSEGGGK